jgi:hypothetical protein
MYIFPSLSPLARLLAKAGRVLEV